ncbi:mammalian cell entry protein [Nocardioides aromaticivorans]|uniref:Mammalian cell entry protein n=1 Tax=Nocardioides aromaticivorans TaxID=200618 RepID=A0ABX7PHK8_9ACTN|nr:MlaD family protein [Nocardioides aromaticivorans]QSR25376.1 mammalian cell entry protein [Nocardioides aromaticivorans]
MNSKPRLSALSLGRIFVAVAAVSGALLFQKAQLAAMLRPGDTVQIQFSEAHRLRTSVSDVKMSGVDIGVVRSVEDEDGVTTVTVKVDDDTRKAMGTAPSARVRPTTLLGGNYYVEIVPGGRRGEFEGTIPVERTELPVELDGVASAFPADARTGVRSSTKVLDSTLDEGGTRALREILESAPGTLRSTDDVLRALQGTSPRTDLADLVRGGENASTVLSSENARLGDTVDALATTARVLEARRHDVAEAARTMPASLDETATLLDSLDGVLASLEATADPARPSVRELARLLDHADPVLGRARPVVRDLRGVLRDARPLVTTLIPISRDLDATVDNVRGPVLDRVNGPIVDQLTSSWHGTGEYEGGGADRPLYKETGYMFANLTQANMMDENGSMVSFLPGMGPGSLAGLPISLEDLLVALTKGGQ